MATSKPHTDQADKAESTKTKGLKIVSRRESGFRRCGRVFGSDGTVIPLDELTADEVKTLKAEKQLVVVEVDIDAAPDAA